MQSVLLASPAVFFEFDFVRRIDLVFLRNIILRFTDRADEGKDLTGAFFGHDGIILR